VHVYLNHEHLVAEQVTRTPRPFPKLGFTRQPDNIFDYRLEDVSVTGYDPHPHITAPVAV
jgi:thymidylate synthase